MSAKDHGIMNPLKAGMCLLCWLLGSFSFADDGLLTELESLKKQSIELNRELFILEEDLLFPVNTQVSVFVSLDVGAYFNLDSIELRLDDQLVVSHLYTESQTRALGRGGIQRLYLGNLKSGEHELVAILRGLGPENREYKRAASHKFTKGDAPKYLQLVIEDSTAKYQPLFTVKEWE